MAPLALKIKFEINTNFSFVLFFYSNQFLFAHIQFLSRSHVCVCVCWGWGEIDKFFLRAFNPESVPEFEIPLCLIPKYYNFFVIYCLEDDARQIRNLLLLF